MKIDVKVFGISRSDVEAESIEAKRPALRFRDFPKEAMERLLPRLNVQPGRPIAPSAEHESLWASDAQQAQKLSRLESRMARVARRIETDFKNSSIESKQTVLLALAADDSLSPRVRDCFRRYGVILARYVASAEGKGAEEQAALEAKISKLIENATRRARTENAQVQLVTSFEEEQGIAGQEGSFSSLLHEWAYEFSVSQEMMQQMAQQSQQMAEAKDQERAEDVADETRQERIRQEQIRIQRQVEEAREKATGRLKG